MKRYYSIKPFVWDNIFIIILGILLYVGIFIWIRDKYMLVIFFVSVSSVYYIKIIIDLINIIKDILNNSIVEEYMYLRYIRQKKFESLNLFKYYDIVLNRVNKKKYTNEVIYLKSARNIQIEEKSFVVVSYYKNSRIINNIYLYRK